MLAAVAEVFGTLSVAVAMMRMRAGLTPRVRAATAIISSHLLEDLERVVTHLLFLDAGRVQLFGSRDELAEYMREVVTTMPPSTQSGVLRSKRDAEGAWRLVVDGRSFDVDALPTGATCRPLGLSDLFIALNG